MSRLEGVDQSVFQSLEFIIQTMTTAGYGQDAGIWSHPLTFLLVSFMQVSGIGIAFFTLRLIVIPLFTSVEVNLDDRLTPKEDHVIICEYRRDATVLLDELEELGVEYVLLSSSEKKAKQLSDDGYPVIHGSPQSVEAFERAGLDSARAVITDAAGANVNTILTVRSIRTDVKIIALTDDDMEEILFQTGADSALSPHAVLGRRLAEKALSVFSPDLTETLNLGGDLEVMEVSVHHVSRLAGTRIRDSNVREKSGANIIDAWVEGELEFPPDPETIIRPSTVLLIVGERDDLQALNEFSRPVRTLRSHNRIVVAGQGGIGQAAATLVAERGVETTTVDVEATEEADVITNADLRDNLSDAEVGAAGAMIVGPPDDSAGLLTTVLARSLNPNIEILARVSDITATTKALSAGAGYALSVP